MAIRFYILPIEVVENRRGPKYFKWRFDPDPPGIDCPWSMKDYGSIDQAVLVADIAAADHAALVLNADVMALPLNLDSNMNAGAVNTAKTFLEAAGVPAGWVNAGVTYRSVLRTVTALFLFMQRVTAILGRPVTVTQAGLNTQVGNLPADVRDALAQAADEQGFDRTGITGTTTVRQVLKMMADAWGSTPILFGFVTL